MTYSKQARDNLLKAVLTVRDLLERGIPAIRTVAYYDRVLSGNIRDLYNGEIDEGAFVDDMLRLIEEQFRRAWNEGMRNNGLDPEKDMTPEWEAELQEIMAGELDYIEPFAQSIRDAATAQEPIQPYLDRVGLWTNRYNEVVNDSMLITRPDDRFMWVLGATEEHCEECSLLDGVVATAAQWRDSGYQPQHPPNDKLSCGGWRCDCRYEYTEDPLTEGGIPEV